MNEKSVSILMSVYNAEKFLAESIDSILNQSHSEFEFIIIDDGSTDSSPEILKNYTDSRIRIIRKENTGLADSLNIGIKAAKNEFIARMDADDIALPERIELQYRFLTENISYAIVGSNTIEIDEAGESICISRRPEAEEEIKSRMREGIIKEIPYTPFYHSTVMFRKRLFNEAGGYLKEMRKSQDVVLFYRMKELGKYSNIAKPLLKYRIHKSSVSRIEPGRLKAFRAILIEIIHKGTITIDQARFIDEMVTGIDEKSREYLYHLYKAKKLMLQKQNFRQSIKHFSHACKLFPLRSYGYLLFLKTLILRIFNSRAEN